MDNRNLIALAMLLIVVSMGMFKGILNGDAVEKIVTFLAGGVVGVTMPRRGDPKSGSGATVAAIAVFLAVFAGCGTTSPYVGPAGPPTLTGDEWYFPHGINERWTRETVLHVNNSTPDQLDAVLDCEPSARHARKWPGSRFTLHVPPMTVQHILIDPHDHVCSLLTLVADDGR